MSLPSITCRLSGFRSPEVSTRVLMTVQTEVSGWRLWELPVQQKCEFHSTIHLRLIVHSVHSVSSDMRCTSAKCVCVFCRFMRVIPALISTLWAVGCQLRMPTRLECPSSLTTGSVSDVVSPPSGISQIYLPKTQLSDRLHYNITIQCHVSAVCCDSTVTPTMTLQSSEPLAMMLSLWGQNSMSRTGPVWPHTVG